MKRPDFLPTLHNMDAVQLRQCIAHASGLLAHQVGEEMAAAILRRIAGRLLGPVYDANAGRKWAKDEAGVP